MSEKKTTARGAGVGDEAVKERTGKSWRQWYTILDRAGARELDHKGIVAYLVRKYGESISPWWQQQITVAYEQARGFRKVHETPRPAPKIVAVTAWASSWSP